MRRGTFELFGEMCWLTKLSTNRFSALLLTGAIYLCIFNAAPSPVFGQFFNSGNDNEVAKVDPGFPTPIPGKIKALKGQQVTFELTAETKSPASIVEYLIRDFPLAGTIDSLETKESSRRVAIMKYTPKLNTAATTDVFTFSTRYPGGRWSAPKKFEIILVDAVPIMEGPQAVDFGQVMIGEEVVKEIYIKNSGNALYDQVLQMTEPWQLVSPKDGRVSVPIGGSKILKVAYRPFRTETTTYQFTINRNPGGVIQLRGDAYKPFSIKEPKLELKINEEKGNREGSITVISHAPKTIVLKLRTSERLMLENQSNELFIGPGIEKLVPVYLPASDSAGFQGTLEVSAESGYLQNANVTAPTLPGRLKIEIPGAPGGTLINMGDVIQGQVSQTGLVMKNVGGEPIEVSFDVNAPFKVLTSGNGIINPQTAQPMAISFSPTSDDSGLFDETLFLRTRTQQISVRLLAIAKAKPGSDAQKPQMRVGGFSSDRRDSSSPSTKESLTSPDQPPAEGQPERSASRKEIDEALARISAMQSISGFITVPLKERVTAENLHPPTDFELIGGKPTELQLKWKATESSPDHEFELEMRADRFIDELQRLESVWVPIDNVVYNRKDDEVIATVKGLAPNCLYEFRAFTTNANGASSLPSIQFAEQTPMPMDWTYIYLTLGILIIATIFFFLIRAIIRQRKVNPFIDHYGY